LLPSLDSNANTVDLTELLGALRRNLRGKEFYTSGNPTLNLVVRDFALMSQVQGYINAIKNAGAPVTGKAEARARVGVKPAAAVKAAATKKVAAKKRGA
jgi:hypothetical protein